MPLVSPFTGLLFDESRGGPAGSVTAPPYDSISAEHERQLHSASPHNVVRLILGRDEPGDDAARNKYTRASDLLRALAALGFLFVHDASQLWLVLLFSSLLVGISAFFYPASSLRNSHSASLGTSRPRRV